MKTYSAKILADSISPEGIRLTTVEATYPRIIHGEVMTHRQFSRNAASSRAIPIQKMIDDIINNPYIPSYWGKNQSGMQANFEIDDESRQKAISVWLEARDMAVSKAKELLDIGIHKQLTNRLLEPFQWYTVIISATEWENFFNLRIHPDAHPDIRLIALEIKKAMNNSTPNKIGYSEWHLPLINDEDRKEACSNTLLMASAGRCARVSYLTHDGKRDLYKDVELCERLIESGHWSPLEHVARPMSPNTKTLWQSNFKGWVQYRKLYPRESCAKMHE